MKITEELIRQLVTEVVEKVERMTQQEADVVASPATEVFRGKVLSASDVEYFFRQKVDRLIVSKSTIQTPLAQERSRDLGVEIEIQ